MPRIRTIKPESSFNDELFDMEMDTGWPIRFIWAVLPCHCDREGRFKYAPIRLKAQILPWDDLDFSKVLNSLWERGFIERYSVDESEYGCIPTFLDHQVINNRESESKLPKPNENNMLTRESGVKVALKDCESTALRGKEGKEGKERKTRGFNFKRSLLDLGVSDSVASDWLKVRSKKKASNTETAFKKIKSQIEKSGKNAEHCITTCVENSWSGFNSEWIVGKDNNPNGGMSW